MDQVIFVSQAGANKHEHVCESLELFGKKVLPRFTDGREEREAAKRERLAEARERALARRSPARVADPGYVITPRGEPTSAQVIAAARRAGSNGSVNGRRHLGGQRFSKRASRSLPHSCAGAATPSSSAPSGRTPVCDVIFKAMERAFVPERANGFSGEIQYELTGPQRPEALDVRIEDGRRA